MATTVGSLPPTSANLDPRLREANLRRAETPFLISWLFRLYRFVLGPSLTILGGTGVSCRFEPSCSCYAEEAFQKHGLLIGSRLTINRLIRCHPWSSRFGFDPVPQTIQKKVRLGKVS